MRGSLHAGFGFLVVVSLVFYLLYYGFPFSLSEFAQIATVILGFAAIGSLFYQKRINFLLHSPELKVVLTKEVDCHHINPGTRGYYLRLKVCNVGRESALGVEALFDSIEMYNETRAQWENSSGFHVPSNLYWSFKGIVTKIDSFSYKYLDVVVDDETAVPDYLHIRQYGQYKFGLVDNRFRIHIMISGRNCRSRFGYLEIDVSVNRKVVSAFWHDEERPQWLTKVK